MGEHLQVPEDYFFCCSVAPHCPTEDLQAILNQISGQTMSQGNFLFPHKSFEWIEKGSPPQKKTPSCFTIPFWRNILRSHAKCCHLLHVPICKKIGKKNWLIQNIPTFISRSPTQSEKAKLKRRRRWRIAKVMVGLNETNFGWFSETIFFIGICVDMNWWHETCKWIGDQIHNVLHIAAKKRKRFSIVHRGRCIYGTCRRYLILLH